MAGCYPRLAVHCDHGVMPPEPRIRNVRLRVRDRAAQEAFWYELIGARDDQIVLVDAPDASIRPAPSIGLYHVALLLPDRAALGAVLRRIVDAGYAGFEGASDHGVSEAFYFRDPEGNGLELYRDRPPAEWPRAADGSLAMTTDPVDAEGVFASASGPAPVAGGTIVGHIHHHVADLDAARAEYAALGLDMIAELGGQALFASYDDYHHHVGANTWARGRTAPPDATGLIDWELRTPAGWQTMPSP